MEADDGKRGRSGSQKEVSDLLWLARYGFLLGRVAGLPPAAVAVLLDLASRVGPNGAPWIGATRLSRDIGRTVRQTKAALAVLKKTRWRESPFLKLQKLAHPQGRVVKLLPAIGELNREMMALPAEERIGWLKSQSFDRSGVKLQAPVKPESPVNPWSPGDEEDSTGGVMPAAHGGDVQITVPVMSSSPKGSRQGATEGGCRGDRRYPGR